MYNTQDYYFAAWCGGVSWQVWLSWSWGGGSTISVSVCFKRPDGWYYQGDMIKRPTGWIGPEKFTTDDVQILAEIIEQNFKFPDGNSRA